MKQETQPINITIQPPRKSVVAAFLLTFFFGPLGMLYSTVTGGIIMLVVCLAILGLTVVTMGLASALMLPAWIVCIVWGVVAAARAGAPVEIATPVK